MPSSRFLVDRLLAGIDFTRAVDLVELGVGTGCVTREILRRMRPDARLISLEINPKFLDVSRRIADSRLTLRNACASALPVVLAEESVDRVDAIVSSLPLKIMDQDVVDRILDVCRACLRPDGRFHQYQYSLSHYPKLAERYGDVDVRFTIRNTPPAFVYQCSGASGGAPPPGRARLRPSIAAVYAGMLATVAMMFRSVQGP